MITTSPNSLTLLRNYVKPYLFILDVMAVFNDKNQFNKELTHELFFINIIKSIL